VPEGDTVLVAASRLHRAMAGRVLLSTDVRVPAFATSDLSGQVLDEVATRGKHLLFRTDAGFTIHTHFRMDGRFELRRPEQRPPGRMHEIRLILRTEPWVAYGRLLGLLEVIRTENEAGSLGHLGPDVLGPDWDPDEALRRLCAEPHRAIGEAILDQRVMAGPGNIYKAELLFLRGIDPWTRVGDVRDPAALVALTKRVMEANRTIGTQVTTGDTRAGRSHWVYGRGGEPCRRCGTPIRSAEQGPDAQERITYWCPHCQPRTVVRGGGSNGSAREGRSGGR
jgi:endonuclease VIII